MTAYHVTQYGHEDMLVEADDYDVDEDGDLVFWALDEEDDELVEVGRFVEGGWTSVVLAADEVDEDELDEDLDEDC